MKRNHTAEVAAELYDMPLPVKKKTKRKKGDPFDREWQIQAACVKEIRKRMKTDPDLEFLANNSEALRNPARAAVAKMMGLRPGPSDILLFKRWKIPAIAERPYARTGMRLVWVELKLPGKNLTEEQERWHDWFHEAGSRCYRCDNVGYFKKILDML